MSCWLSEHYLSAIDVLKQRGLWTLDDGLFLLPYLQHCLPPPHIGNIHQSMEDLISMGVNTDWFPLKEMKRLQKKLRFVGVVEREESEGTDFPVHYGIHRINAQPYWENSTKQLAVTRFVEFVFKNIGPVDSIKITKFYSDVYTARDSIINIVAKEHGEVVFGQHKVGLDRKIPQFNEIKSQSRWIGSHNKHIRKRNPESSFWRDPPSVPFTITAPNTPEKTRPINTDPSTTILDDPDDLSELSKEIPSNHQSVIPKLLVKWARQNVRCEADANALSWSSIFRYWEFLLSKSRTSQALVSILAMTTGISKKRWMQLSQDKSALNDGGLLLGKSHQHLIYKVHDISANFEMMPRNQTPISQCIQLALPDCWADVLDNSVLTLKSGLKEESSLRGFSRKYGGPTPTINRVARSGHALLRREFLGELNSHRLAGKIPIELQNRSAYQAVSNKTINEKYQSTLQSLLLRSSNHQKEFPRLYNFLKPLESSDFPDVSDHSIGSQLSETPSVSFKAPKIQQVLPIMPIRLIIHELNKLELHYFWMQQFAMADRAVGELTETTYAESLRWHSDKDSHEYKESRILQPPDLLLQQFDEIRKSRSKLLAVVANHGHRLPLSEHDHRAMIFKNGARNSVKATVLDSKTALQQASEIWGYQPIHKRSNAHRHMRASSIATRHPEILVDALLGHHVDGWDLFAPESSANLNMMEVLQESSGKTLQQLGFRLARSPWA